MTEDQQNHDPERGNVGNTTGVLESGGSGALAPSPRRTGSVGTTRAQSTIETVRAMILDGDLRPGARVQAQALADRLGVSRTPVVDALTVLHKEGLLEYAPNRGYGVRRFTLKDVLDAFDVRLVLEGLGCRLIAERGMEEAVARAVRDNLTRSEAVLYGAEWSGAQQDEWQQLNREFHDLLLAATANAYLSDGVANARAIPVIYGPGPRPIDVGEIQRLYRRDQSQQAFRDHRRIVDAVCAGQGTRAENLMKEHIFVNREAIRRHLTTWFRERGSDEATAAQADAPGGDSPAAVAADGTG